VSQFFIIKKFGNAIVKNIGEGLNELLGTEVVKRGMSIIGKQGGDTKAVNAIKNKLAKGAINKNYGMIKILAEQVVGIDVDELIEEYGAENILTAVSQLGPKLGIDISSILGGKGLSTTKNVGYPREE